MLVLVLMQQQYQNSSSNYKNYYTKLRYKNSAIKMNIERLTDSNIEG